MVEIFEIDDAGELILPPRIVIDGYDGKKCFYCSLETGDGDNDGQLELIVGWNKERYDCMGTLLGYKVDQQGARPVYTFAYEDNSLDNGIFEKTMSIADADNDGLGAEQDNCPDVPLGEEQDLDDDGKADRCDDGNSENGDGCDANCTPTGCGNGIQTTGELCDDGNLEDGDGCDATCGQAQLQGECGDNLWGPHEECDDGNQITERCAYGEISCVVCNAECQQVAFPRAGPGLHLYNRYTDKTSLKADREHWGWGGAPRRSRNGP